MPANILFLDTQGWLALLNTRDRLHSFASAEWQRRRVDGDSVLLTDWIIAETGNGLARTTVREGFAESVKAVLVDSLMNYGRREPSRAQPAAPMYPAFEPSSAYTICVPAAGAGKASF